MSLILQLTIKALDILSAYPVLIDYIKNYEGYKYGFMYKTDEKAETDTDTNIELQDQLDKLLNSDRVYNGESWITMLQIIQDVLNNNITREEILQKIKSEYEDGIYDE